MMESLDPPLLERPATQEMLQSFTSVIEPPWAEALVFEGGGTKGIHYAGAISCLEENGCLQGVKRFGGTSAGAQTAALLAFGYTGKDFEILMRETPWSTLLDGAGPPCGWGCCCGYGCCKGCCRLYTSQGFYVGSVLEHFLDAKFAERRVNRQPGCTFKQLYDERGSELRVGVCNMTTKTFEYLDRYTHPNLCVSQAVRASSAIPLVFLPQNIAGNVYIDGMFQGNLPIAAFPDKRTLAFHLTTSEGTGSAVVAVSQRRQSTLAFISDILDMLMSSAQRKHGFNFMSFNPRDAQQVSGPLRPKLDILTIDCGQAGSLDVGVNQRQIQDMMDAGRRAATEYLEDPKRKRLFSASNTRSFLPEDPDQRERNVREAISIIQQALQSRPHDESLLGELRALIGTSTTS